MNYYCFHVGDYATHTRHIDLIEDLAYRRILDLYYTREMPIQGDVEKVARLIGMRDHIQSVSNVLSDFFLKSEEGYKNKRCDDEISAYHAKAARAKNANQTRWASRKSNLALISDIKSDVISESDKIPTNNQEPIKRIGGKFTPPTLDEIKDFCLERKNNVFPQRFFDFYTSKGWMIGKNKMKDWRAAVRTWEKDTQAQQQGEWV